ncbi:hypothetical protein [Treponema pedis]|uniref:hypothetical protein n=1 Tax=Treponema pedis TaxID=409322 RepID=UPI000407936B|nr:hypothetical protein [Treponema pedis]QSI04594.1 hypothetical protein DYQ05_06420 [Treponema pedis]
MVKLTEIRNILEKEKPDDLFLQYFEWVKTLMPFWKQAVMRIAELNGTPEEKRDKHLRAIDNSLELMPAWRFKRIKYVKARREEIDSAISFIRNGAITNKVSKYAFAPVCRTVASVLRSCLYVSTFGYSDEQQPTVLAQDVYDIAMCHTLFPFDTSDFVYYLPRNKSIHTEDPADLDNWHIMMSNAGKALKITDLIEEVNKQACIIWENYKTPLKWKYDESIWSSEFENVSKKLHYAAEKAFHKM